MTMSWLRSKAKLANAGAWLMSTSWVLVANSTAFRGHGALANRVRPLLTSFRSEEFQRSCPLRMYRDNRPAHRTPREKPQRLPASALPQPLARYPRLVPVGVTRPGGLLEIHPG